MRFQRVPEEHEQVDLPIRDAGPDLLIPAEWPAVEPGHRQADFLAEHPAGGAGREQAVLGKEVAVELGPLTHVPLTAVVRDERDPAPRRCFSETVVGRHGSSMPDRCCGHGTARLAPCVRPSTSPACMPAGALPWWHAFRSAAPYLAAPTRWCGCPSWNGGLFSCRSRTDSW